MPFKDPQKKKEYHRRYMRDVWYPRNKAKHKRAVKASRERSWKKPAKKKTAQTWLSSIDNRP